MVRTARGRRAGGRTWACYAAAASAATCRLCAGRLRECGPTPHSLAYTLHIILPLYLLTAIDQKQEAPAAVPAAAKSKAGPAKAKQLKGFDLEQQIYSIVAPPRAAGEEAMLPEGVTTYAQLAMASDAPRFLRAAANVADISPQRLHPTRLFFPQQTYAPGVRAI